LEFKVNSNSGNCLKYRLINLELIISTKIVYHTTFPLLKISNIIICCSDFTPNSVFPFLNLHVSTPTPKLARHVTTSILEMELMINSILKMELTINSILELIHMFMEFIKWNRQIQAKCVASVTNCGLGLETAMMPTVNRGCQLFTNGKYCKLFHITQRLRLVFQLNDCVFPKDITQYLSGYNPMIERTGFSR